jgi:hypothetical protein
MLDRELIPTQLRTGPAVGFLALTESLVFFRLADSQNTTDWQKVSDTLKRLDRQLREYLACEELDPDIARELIIHRDRVTLTLDWWDQGSVNHAAHALAVKQEQLIRQQQKIGREEVLRAERLCRETV